MPGLHMSKADFFLPTDSEHKATKFRPWVLGGVHMSAFHLSWISFFCASFSFMAPAALLPTIRDGLDLTNTDIQNANMAAFSGVLSARIAAGLLCDVIGARLTHAWILILTAPAMFTSCLVTNAVGFIVCRFFIGFSLASFVACQYWCSEMFNVKIVGQVNAMAAGCGSAGSWASLMLVPLIQSYVERNADAFVAWRYAIWVPGMLQVIVGLAILQWTQDVPDGSNEVLRKQIDTSKPRCSIVLWTGVSNHRMWILVCMYAFSSGVEVIMQYVMVPYLFDHFGVSIHQAGHLVSLLFLLSTFSRVLGGYMSDKLGGNIGIRGRLALIWITQSVSGILVMVLGLSSGSFLSTVVLLGAFSVLVMAAQGAIFAVVPFVSKRALGVVTGFVGAGSNVGSALLQGLLFWGDRMETNTSIMLMGLFAFVLTQPILLLHFPQWGGVFSSPQEGCLEEDYYLEEFTADEVASGEAHASLIFAVESRTQRRSMSVGSNE